MAFPLLFIAGGALVRALTPAIASYMAKQGIKKVATSGIKAALKKYGKPKTISTISKVKDFKGSGASAASKELMKKLKVPKSSISGKVIAAAGTVASIPALIAKDDKTAKADTKKNKVDAGLQEALKKKKAKDAKNKKMDATEKSTRGQKSKSTTTTKKKGSDKVGGGPKVIVTKEQLAKSGLSLRDYMNMLESKRLGRKISRDPRNDKKTVKKVEKKTEKKVEKKTPNYGGSRAIPKKTEKKAEPKKSKSFLDRVKSDFNKAVKETKRNFSDKRYFVNGVDSRKEKIKSKSNIKKKK